MSGASAQDIPLVRKLLERVIVGELTAHDSQQTAWFNDKCKDKQKVVQLNLFGREIDRKVASWTEESKTWFWLEDLVTDALNDHVRDKNHKLRRSVEKAIDRVKI